MTFDWQASTEHVEIPVRHFKKPLEAVNLRCKHARLMFPSITYKLQLKVEMKEKLVV
jgi:hypothetical protein